MTYHAETLDAAQAEIVRLQKECNDQRRDAEDVRILLGIEDEEQIREAVQQVIDEREMLQSAYDEGQEEIERLRTNWTRDQAALALARDEIERLRGDLELSRRGEAYQMREHDAAQAAVEEKDAEIERLRAELEEEAGIMRALRRHRDEAEAALVLAHEALRKIVGARNRADCAAFAEDALSAPAMQRVAELDAARKEVLYKRPMRSDTGHCYCCGGTGRGHNPGCEEVELERLEAADE